MVTYYTVQVSDEEEAVLQAIATTQHITPESIVQVRTHDALAVLILRWRVEQQQVNQELLQDVADASDDVRHKIRELLRKSGKSG